MCGWGKLHPGKSSEPSCRPPFPSFLPGVEFPLWISLSAYTGASSLQLSSFLLSSGGECESPWLSISHGIRTSEHPFWGRWEGKTNFCIYPSSLPHWKNPHPKGNLLSITIPPRADLQAAIVSREHHILLVFPASWNHGEAKVATKRILILSFLCECKWCKKKKIWANAELRYLYLKGWVGPVLDH